MSDWFCGFAVVCALLALSFGLIGATALVTAIPADSTPFPDNQKLSLMATYPAGFIEIGIVFASLFSILLIMFCNDTQVRCLLCAIMGLSSMMILCFYLRPSLLFLTATQLLVLIALWTDWYLPTHHSGQTLG